MRLAQDFAVRYPLVEGQGNFGNIDGDNAAAMRYTEARLTEVAKALLAGIDEDAVDFRPTYDGEESEPVCSRRFPNLLANGAAGIAVGMATSIPPHNAGEVCAAAIDLVRPARDRHRRAAQVHAGSRFPHRRHLSRTRRRFWLPTRAAAAVFAFAPNGRWSRASTAPGASSSRKFPIRCRSRELVEQIAQLMEEKKLPLLGDMRDESTEEDPARAGAADAHRRAGSPDGGPVPGTALETVSRST